MYIYLLHIALIRRATFHRNTHSTEDLHNLCDIVSFVIFCSLMEGPYTLVYTGYYWQTEIDSATM